MRILKWFIVLVIVLALVIGVGGMLLPREVLMVLLLPCLTFLALLQLLAFLALLQFLALLVALLVALLAALLVAFLVAVSLFLVEFLHFQTEFF